MGMSPKTAAQIVAKADAKAAAFKREDTAKREATETAAKKLAHQFTAHVEDQSALAVRAGGKRLRPGRGRGFLIVHPLRIAPA